MASEQIIPPQENIREGRLKTGTFYTQEVYQNKLLDGITAVAGRWGQPIIKSEDDGTGFRTLFQSRQLHEDPASNEQMQHQEELEVAKLCVDEICVNNRWKPEEIDCVIFGNGMLDRKPEEYIRAFSRQIGLSQSAEQRAQVISLACNSFGKAFNTAVADPELEGKKVVVMDVERITRYMGTVPPLHEDLLSRTVFSDGYAAVGFVPGVSIEHLYSESYEEEDTRGALSAITAYRDFVDFSSDEFIHHDDRGEFIRLPRPPEGQWIQMSGSDTAKHFLRMLGTLARSFQVKVGELFPDIEIHQITGHHASRGVNISLGNLLQKIGLLEEIGRDEQRNFSWKNFKWLVPDGNASGATSGIALSRLLPVLEKDQNILMFSFGAGASATASLYRV